jgi:hypothetical protein
MPGGWKRRIVIVYLATYPRSGHALTRGLIYRNFGLLVANGYPEVRTPAKPKLHLSAAPERHPDFPPGLAWGDWTLVYRSPHTRTMHRLLDNDAHRRLTPELRAELAAEANLFFVKTHEPPLASYLPGETAIQMVRHPGGACASYLHMLMNFHPDKVISLSEILRGVGVPGGGWSSYHHAWRAASLPVLRLRYEDLLVDQAPAVRAMARFLGVDLQGDVIQWTLEEARAANPKRNPGAGLDGWRKDFSQDDFAILRHLHGSVAAQFGYDLAPPMQAPRRSGQSSQPAAVPTTRALSY